jgi:CheY-like chemotaxis protein
MFAIQVPLAPAGRGETTPTAAPANAGGSLLGQRIVCLDNEPEVLAGMEALLREWGLSIETAGSADAITSRRIGFPRLRHIWPDVILADYHLDNGQTGLEAIARIRTSSGFEIPAIIITADHSTDIQREIRNAGLVQLRKPVKPAALRAVLTQAALTRRRAAAE